MSPVRAFVTALVLGVLAVATTFVVGMRAKSPLVVDAVRRCNRAVVHPRQLRTAGSPGAYAAVVRHRGRTSGRAYQTPVGATATDDGFVVALPYGSRPDWLQNVLAAERAIIVHQGRAHEVDRPVVLPMRRVADRFPANEQRSHRLFRVEQCLRVRCARGDTVAAG